jgi:hypothetical protein
MVPMIVPDYEKPFDLAAAQAGLARLNAFIAALDERKRKAARLIELAEREAARRHLTLAYGGTALSRIRYRLSIGMPLDDVI